MAGPQVDPEIIATIKSAQALSYFAHYVKSLDNTLTLAEATAVAAAVVMNLPILFDANPSLKELVRTAITEARYYARDKRK